MRYEQKEQFTYSHVGGEWGCGCLLLVISGAIYQNSILFVSDVFLGTFDVQRILYTSSKLSIQ